MAHVATFHLGDAHAALGDPKERGWPDEAAELLPEDGYIQVFHDLETYGYEPDDVEAGALESSSHSTRGGRA